MVLRLLAFQACFLAAATAQTRDGSGDPANPPFPTPASTRNGVLVIRDAEPLAVRSVFKINKAELKEIDAAAKQLTIEISYHSDKKPDLAALYVVSTFYDSNADGSVTPSQSQLAMEWATLPTDWQGHENESLTIGYPGPPSDSGRKFVGYTVGVYYKDDLQDSYGSRPEMLELFPLPTMDNRDQSLGESSRFQSAYRAFQRAEKSFENGDFIKAREAIRKAVAGFDSLQKDSPEWQPRMVDYRLAVAKLLESRIDEK